MRDDDAGAASDEYFLAGSLGPCPHLPSRASTTCRRRIEDRRARRSPSHVPGRGGGRHQTARVVDRRSARSFNRMPQRSMSFRRRPWSPFRASTPWSISVWVAMATQSIPAGIFVVCAPWAEWSRLVVICTSACPSGARRSSSTHTESWRRCRLIRFARSMSLGAWCFATSTVAADCSRAWTAANRRRSTRPSS